MLILDKERSVIASIEDCKGVVAGLDFRQPIMTDHEMGPDLRDSFKYMMPLYSMRIT